MLLTSFVLLLVAVVQSAAAPPAIAVDVLPKKIQPGQLVVLTITTPDGVDGVRARAFTKTLTPFRVDPRTWRVLVGVDLDVAPGSYDVAIVVESAGRSNAHTAALAVQPRSFPTRVLKVNPAFVNPPARVLARIEAESKLLARTWTQSASDKLWSDPFAPAVPQPANSAFGSRSIFNGEARSPHTGADFLSPAGTPITAPSAGRVVIARDLYYSGGTVIVDHGLGFFSLFAHMSKIAAHEGQTVTTGDVLGKVGATGRVTGAHLHWAIRINDARVDPLSVLAVLGSGR